MDLFNLYEEFSTSAHAKFLLPIPALLSYTLIFLFLRER
jgi:hypothetical protein